MSSGHEKRLIVVGLGRIGVLHAALIARLPGVCLAGIVDRQKSKAGYARSLGMSTEFFTSSQAALEHLHPDGACICTPQFAHLESARPFLEAGMPVFVEKPLAHTVSAAQDIYDLARAPVAVGYMKAHEPIYRHAEELLQLNLLGPLHEVRAEAKFGQVLRTVNGWIYTKALAGGGALINAGIHALHLMFRMGGAIERVSAKCEHIYSRQVEDVVNAEFEFRCGARGKLSCSWSVAGYDTLYTHIELYGKSGVMRVTDHAIHLELEQDGCGFNAGQHTIYRSLLPGACFNLSPDYAGDGYCRQMQNFAQCVTDGTAPRVGGQEALSIQKVVEAIYASAQSGSSVGVSE